MPKRELFVGNLSRNVSIRDVEELFEKYGRILRCDIKTKGFGSSFCFVEFEEERDAEEALKNENGKELCGSSMIVEWAKGKPQRNGDRNGDRRDNRNFNFNGRDSRNGYNFRRSDRNGNKLQSLLECFNCGMIGHFARDCFQGNSRGANDTRRVPRKERYSRSRSRSRSQSRSRSR